MQKFKKYVRARHIATSSPHSKFIYSNDRLCQYARWRNEQIESLNDAALNRYLRTADGHRAYLLDAHFCVGAAGALRALSTLVFARLSDA